MDILKNRITTHSFAKGAALSAHEVRDLIATVTMTPSSFNIQHWRFIAVTDQARKDELQAIAFNQSQVGDSAVTFIVLADLRGHELAQEIMDRSVVAGTIERDAADQWVAMSARRYGQNPAEARDEAIRSGSMASMALMAAVADKGWVSCPMIGFEPARLKEAFAINERYLPIMLIAVGRAPARRYGRMERLTVDEVLEFNHASMLA